MILTLADRYFCRPYIEAYFLKSPEHSKFINREVLEKYWDVGGVRIEDEYVKSELPFHPQTPFAAVFGGHWAPLLPNLSLKSPRLTMLDSILVTEDGYENLTTAPKGEEMLKIINGGIE